MKLFGTLLAIALLTGCGGQTMAPTMPTTGTYTSKCYGVVKGKSDYLWRLSGECSA